MQMDGEVVRPFPALEPCAGVHSPDFFANGNPRQSMPQLQANTIALKIIKIFEALTDNFALRVESCESVAP
jgi:hypothetical protein